MRRAYLIGPGSAKLLAGDPAELPELKRLKEAVRAVLQPGPVRAARPCHFAVQTELTQPQVMVVGGCSTEQPSSVTAQLPAFGTQEADA